MCQVLFSIPLHLLNHDWPDLPIYGYGTMLFLAFVLCTWLAARLAGGEGIPRESIQDLAIWLFISGIVGARITYMIQYRDRLVRRLVPGVLPHLGGRPGLLRLRDRRPGRLLPGVLLRVAQI